MHASGLLAEASVLTVSLDQVEQYLHAGARALPGQKLLREVNASQALKTRWKINMFSEFKKGQDAVKLTAGTVVRLFHPESDTSLTVGASNAETGHCDVLLQGFDGEAQLEKHSTNAMWMVEKEDVVKGGVCRLIDAGVPVNYRFRHMATGRYLSAILPEAPIAVVKDEEDEEEEEFLEEGLDEEEDEEGDLKKSLLNDAQESQWSLNANDTTREKASLWCFEANVASIDKAPSCTPVMLRHARSSRYIYAGEAKKDKTDPYEGAIASYPTLGTLLLVVSACLLTKLLCQVPCH